MIDITKDTGFNKEYILNQIQSGYDFDYTIYDNNYIFNIYKNGINGDAEDSVICFNFTFKTGLYDTINYNNNIPIQDITDFAVDPVDITEEYIDQLIAGTKYNEEYKNNIYLVGNMTNEPGILDCQLINKIQQKTAWSDNNNKLIENNIPLFIVYARAFYVNGDFYRSEIKIHDFRTGWIGDGVIISEEGANGVLENPNDSSRKYDYQGTYVQFFEVFSATLFADKLNENRSEFIENFSTTNYKGNHLSMNLNSVSVFKDFLWDHNNIQNENWNADIINIPFKHEINRTFNIDSSLSSIHNCTPKMIFNKNVDTGLFEWKIEEPRKLISVWNYASGEPDAVYNSIYWNEDPTLNFHLLSDNIVFLENNTKYTSDKHGYKHYKLDYDLFYECAIFEKSATLDSSYADYKYKIRRYDEIYDVENYYNPVVLGKIYPQILPDGKTMFAMDEKITSIIPYPDTDRHTLHVASHTIDNTNEISTNVKPTYYNYYSQWVYDAEGNYTFDENNNRLFEYKIWNGDFKNNRYKNFEKTYYNDLQESILEKLNSKDTDYVYTVLKQITTTDVCIEPVKLFYDSMVLYESVNHGCDYNLSQTEKILDAKILFMAVATDINTSNQEVVRIIASVSDLKTSVEKIRPLGAIKAKSKITEV